MEFLEASAAVKVAQCMAENIPRLYNAGKLSNAARIAADDWQLQLEVLMGEQQALLPHASQVMRAEPGLMRGMRVLEDHMTAALITLEDYNGCFRETIYGDPQEFFKEEARFLRDTIAELFDGPGKLRDVRSRLAASGGYIAKARSRWQFLPPATRNISIRGEATIDGNKTQAELAPGDEFLVSEELVNGGVTFLRLADGRGWLFDRIPGVGQLCVRISDQALALGVAVEIIDDQKAGQSVEGTKSMCGEYSHLLEAVDTNGDGTITHDEFINAIMARIIAPATSVAGKVFSCIDLDGNGSISRAEFAAAVSRGDIVEDAQYLRKYFHLLQEVDTNGDGIIEVDEVINALEAGKIEQAENVIGKLFTCLDKDGDGFISRAEFAAAVVRGDITEAAAKIV